MKRIKTLLILKDLLIYETSNSFDFNEVLGQTDTVRMSKILDHETVSNMIDIIMSTLKDFKNVNDINPLFEVTLLKLTAMNVDKKVDYRDVSPLRYEAPVKNGPGDRIVNPQPSLFDEEDVPAIKEEAKPIEIKPVVVEGWRYK